MRSILSKWTIAFLCLLACASVLPAQVTSGTITGSVVDPSGAAVVGANITASDTEKGTSYTRKSDESGQFQIPFLVPGTYKVTAEAPGFKKAEAEDIRVYVDQRAKVDFTMTVGNVSETVEVTAAAPLVQSQSAETGQVINTRAVQDLPLNGRNFAQLVYLAPGVTPGQAGENLSGASTFNPRASSNFNPLGARANANGWLIDGIDNNEYTFNTVIVQPSVESVREFKALTGSFSSEFGRGAGVVTVSTRSGANDLHGTAFWFLRNIVFDARNYFSPARNALGVENPKPPFRRNQYGGAISGPVIKNKIFFWGDYWGMTELRGNAYVNSVPTAAARTGDFSRYVNTAGNRINIFNPFTTRANPANPSQFIRDPFPDNIIPQNLIDPVGRNMMSIYPLPNTLGTAQGNFNNFNSVANRVIEDNGYNFRFDYQASQKDNMFFRFTQEWFDLDAPQGQAQCCLPTPAEAASKFTLGPWVAGIQNTRLRTYGGAFSWSRVWTPALVGELRAGFARTNPSTFQSDYGINAAASLGMQNVNVTDNATGLPNVNITDITGLSGGPAFLPAKPKQINYQIDYNLYWNIAKHTIKFGYHVVRRDVSPFTNGDTRGSITFGTAWTRDPLTNQGGTGPATALLGIIQSASRGILLDTPGLRVWENAFFIQDDWKVTRRLTVNLGVRYEIFSPETEQYNRMTSFDLTKLMFAYANENGYSRTLRNTDMNNFGPRIGMAYDVTGTGRIVMRAGYGISYFPEPVSASSMLTQGAPWLNSVSYSYGDNLPAAAYADVPRISMPFGPLVPLKPQTTAEINARTPTVRGYSFNNPTQYAESYTFNIQSQIGANWMAEVGYVGSRGINLLYNYNHNEALLGTAPLADRRPYQALRNIPNITIFEPMNMSNYNGLIGKLEKRFSNGFQLLAAYTYSKSLDMGGSVASGGGSSGQAQTVYCLRCGRGPSGFDVTQRFVMNGLWNLPVGKGQKYNIDNKAMDYVIGGWQLGGIITGTTGRPYNVGLQNGVNNGSPSWPDRIGTGELENPMQSYWFNPADFKAPAPNTYGNVARGVLYSPGVFNIDMSIVKTFAITERVGLNFRFEAFNLFNTPYFGFPNANIGSPTVGQITSTVGDNRSLQFALRLNF